MDRDEAQVRPICFVDVETTGLKSATNSICELAALKFTPYGRLRERFVRLIRPNKAIPYKLTRIHGLSNAMVASAYSFCEIAKEFLAFVEGAVIAGYNVSFDIGFINNELLSCGFAILENPVLDVLTLARDRLRLPSYKLEFVARSLGFKFDRFHWAETDAMATAYIYFTLKA